MYAILMIHSHKHHCFTPNGNNTFPSLMLTPGGMKPSSSITLPLGVAIYYLDKVTNGNREHARLLKNKNIKGQTKYITHHKLNIIS